MMAWWNGLSFALQVLYCIAIPSTLVLIIQGIMLAVGFGDNGEGVNFSDTSGLDIDTGDIGDMDLMDVTDIDDVVSAGDGSAPGDFSVMSMFTLQGAVTFLTVGCWLAIVLISGGFAVALSIIIGVATGIVAMYGVARLLFWSQKMAQNGTLNINILLGESGTVYLPIPPKGQGRGKIMVHLLERYIEMDAISEGKAIAADENVRVVDIISGNILVVEQFEQ